MMKLYDEERVEGELLNKQLRIQSNQCRLKAPQELLDKQLRVRME